MAKCKIDTKASPSFTKAMVKLASDFPNALKDLEYVIPLIEADILSRSANAVRLKMPNHPDLQGKVFKYDFGSSDMGKHPRSSFRFVILFPSDPFNKENKGNVLPAYGIMAYHRPNNDAVMPADVSRCLKELREVLK